MTGIAVKSARSARFSLKFCLIFLYCFVREVPQLQELPLRELPPAPRGDIPVKLITGTTRLSDAHARRLGKLKSVARGVVSEETFRQQPHGREP